MTNKEEIKTLDREILYLCETCDIPAERCKGEVDCKRTKSLVDRIENLEKWAADNGLWAY